MREGDRERELCEWGEILFWKTFFLMNENIIRFENKQLNLKIKKKNKQKKKSSNVIYSQTIDFYIMQKEKKKKINALIIIEYIMNIYLTMHLITFYYYKIQVSRETQNN